MAEPARFLFDRNFDDAATLQESERSTAEAELRAQFEQKLEAARCEAQAQGYGEGQRDAAEAVEARIADALETLLERARNVSNDMSGECDGIRAQAITLAQAMAETLAGELVRREPLAELEALFSECLEQITHAPHLAIRVNDGLLESVQERLAKRASERGFGGKLVVLGDPEMPVGDGRIEWADGGIARDMTEVGRHVDGVVRRYVSSVAKRPACNGSGAHVPGPNGDDDSNNTGVPGGLI